MGVGIAIGLMVAATIAVHMGLPQEVAKVIAKICGCPKCLSFWSVLAMTVTEMPLQYALPLSLLCAYASGWLVIGLTVVNKILDEIWERINE